MASSEQKLALPAKTTKRQPGRPRCEHARQAILRSTLRLLRKTGFAQLSIEAIAADATVGKATVST
jgi:AcrR family transcriptional regulator